MTRSTLLSVAGIAALAVAASAAPPPSASAPLWMTVVIDPRCPQTVSMLARVGEFRRIRPGIPVRLLIPDLAGAAWAGSELISALRRADLTLEWDLDELRALGVAATPAVVVRDSAGRGVLATGVLDLAALADAAAASR